MSGRVYHECIDVSCRETLRERLKKGELLACACFRHLRSSRVSMPSIPPASWSCFKIWSMRDQYTMLVCITSGQIRRWVWVAHAPIVNQYSLKYPPTHSMALRASMLLSLFVIRCTEGSLRGKKLCANELLHGFYLLAWYSCDPAGSTTLFLVHSRLSRVCSSLDTLFLKTVKTIKDCALLNPSIYGNQGDDELRPGEAFPAV